jgi:hypothetical protein
MQFVFVLDSEFWIGIAGVGFHLAGLFISLALVLASVLELAPRKWTLELWTCHI